MINIYVGVDPSINSSGVTCLAYEDGNLIKEMFYIIKPDKLTKKEDIRPAAGVLFACGTVIGALIKLLNELRAKYPKAIIQGHRDFPGVNKACPSFDAKSEYKDIQYEI